MKMFSLWDSNGGFLRLLICPDKGSIIARRVDRIVVLDVLDYDDDYLILFPVRIVHVMEAIRDLRIVCLIGIDAGWMGNVTTERRNYSRKRMRRIEENRIEVHK